MKLSNEVKVGLLTLAGLFVLFFGVKYLVGENPFNDQKVMYAKYDKVSGLEVGNPIMLNGYKVGTVSSIDLAQNGYQTDFNVSFYINGEIEIPRDAIAEIQSAGIMGDKAIHITYSGKTKGTPEFAQEGETIKGYLQPDLTDSLRDEIMPIKDKTEELFTSIDSLVSVVRNLLQSGEVESTLKNVDRSFISIEGLLANMKIVSDELNQFVQTEMPKIGNTLTNVEHMSNSLNANMTKVDKILGNAEQLTDDIANSDLKGTIENAGSAVENLQQSLVSFQTIVEDLESGKGSAGKLLNDDKLYSNLEQASKNLELLLADLKDNPGEYVNFSLIKLGGKKNK